MMETAYKRMIQIGESAATIDTPVEHLMACHRRIEERLTTLERAPDHIQDNPDAALKAIRASLRFLDASGAMHTADEEASLFPRLRPLLSGAELAYLASLEDQHRESEKVYTQLKAAVERLANGDDSDVAEYRALAKRLSHLCRHHIRSEDEVLTGLARRALSDADLQAISREMRGRRQSL